MPHTFIKTKDTIILHFGNATKVVSLSDPRVPKLMELLRADAPKEDILKLIDVGYRIKTHESGLFGVLDGVVYVLNEKLPTSLGSRVLDFVDCKLPPEPLIRFWENCKLNPDPRAKTDLYAFLEHNGHPITSDGCFMAYRYVHKTADGKFMDAHTKTMDNSVGQRVTMKREDCDPNPAVTCSRGLHVATLNYAAGNRSGDCVVVHVKVNPKDVVAIPLDYDGQKMRVCEFVVVSVNETLLEGHLYREVDDTNLDDEDESGAESEASGEDVGEEAVAVALDFSQPQNVAESDAAKKIDTRENHKAQKRDSRGHFIPSRKAKPKTKRKPASKKAKPKKK